MKSLILLFLIAGSAIGLEIVQRGKELRRQLEKEAMDSRIISGVNVDITDYPWQVSLGSTIYGHFCGGVIISNTAILTAAHCVDGMRASQLRVRVGSSSVNDLIAYSVASINVHKDYSENGAQGFPNDIAILTLSQSLAFNNRVNKIAVSTDEPGTFVGVSCTLTGWGRTSGSSSTLPTYLQGADLNAISNQECSDRFTNIAPINDGHVCVYEPPKSACNGDSGGPMVCPSGSGYVLVGVTSWGITDCPGTYPSVYTRVSHFSNWISQNM